MTTQIPKTMFAWQKDYTKSEPTYVEVATPQIPDDGMLIKVWAAGVCHSDISILESKAPPLGSLRLDPFTMGHEGCGEIVRLGPKVSGFALGDMVSIISVPGCNEKNCSVCSRGLPQVCPAGPKYGLEIDGSFAPYVAIQAHAALKLPKGVSPAHGAVATDAVLTAHHAVVGRANVQAGETVLLYGLGGLGFNALQILLDLKARVIPVDKRDTVLEEAVRFGVRREDVVPSNVDNIANWIREKGIVIDKVLNFVGNTESLQTGIEVVRLGGTVVLIGMMAEHMTLHSQTTVLKHVDVLGSMGGTVVDLKAGLDLIARGALVPQVELDKLSNLPEALDRLHHGKVKSRIVLVPDGITL